MRQVRSTYTSIYPILENRCHTGADQPRFLSAHTRFEADGPAEGHNLTTSREQPRAPRGETGSAICKSGRLSRSPVPMAPVTQLPFRSAGRREMEAMIGDDPLGGQLADDVRRRLRVGTWGGAGETRRSSVHARFSSVPRKGSTTCIPGQQRAHAHIRHPQPLRSEDPEGRVHTRFVVAASAHGHRPCHVPSAS